jgi:RNA recognition motif-containing protein
VDPQLEILMKRMFVGNLAPDTREDDLKTLFSSHGTVRRIEMVVDVFSRKCKGFAFVDMEGHEARAAIAALDGRDFKGRPLRVNEERARNRGRRGGRH